MGMFRDGTLARRRTIGIDAPSPDRALRTRERRPMLIFVGCDGRYFELYGPALVASVQINSPHTALHFSVCNPGPDFESAFAALRGKASRVDLSCDTYAADLAALSAEQRRAYFANHRFCRLRDHMALAKQDLLFLDIDCLMRRPAARIQQAFRGCDIAIRLRLHKREEHLKLLASAIYLACNARTLALLDRIATRLEHDLEWYGDQVALYRELRSSDLNVGSLTQDFIDYEFHEHSVIWTGKGPKKLANERYAACAQDLLDAFEAGLERPVDAAAAPPAQRPVSMKWPRLWYRLRINARKAAAQLTGRSAGTPPAGADEP